jgi:hypothetical protein
MDDIELRHEVVGSDEPGATVRDDELLQAGFDAAPHQGMALEHPHGFFDERDDFGRSAGRRCAPSDRHCAGGPSSTR